MAINFFRWFARTPQVRMAPLTRRLAIEILEDRANPSGFSVPWADGAHLTLSFAPDGTAVQGSPSALFQTLAPLGTAATWEREILRAFQTWAANANLNLGYVADSGAPLGSPGAVQGDARFGDIRIAARPLSDGVLASASPFSWTGTTWAGDVVLNSKYDYALGSQAGKYDLYSVFLHEAGHVFGLEHSTSPTDPMFEGYHPSTGLAAEDVSRLRSLYTPRAKDGYDAGSWAGNGSFATASSLGLVLTSAATNGTITTPTDADFYTFTTLPPLGVTAVTVQLKTSGLSQLLPRLSVYEGNGKLIASQAALDPLNGDLTVKVAGINLFSKFYVKVEGATPGVNGVGIYQLRVGYGLSGTGGLLTPLFNIVDDLHLNDTLSAATALVGTKNGPADDRFDYRYQASIRDSSDVDTYTMKAPLSSSPQTLVALAWALEGSALNPRLRVFDASGAPVAFQVLANSAGLFSVQVPGAVSGATYYVQVAAQTPGGSNNTGAYFLGIDFSKTAPLALDSLGSKTIPAAAAVDLATLTAGEDKLLHFSLSATAGAAADVTMTVLDSQGKVQFTLTARANQPSVTGSVYLRAGAYQVRYTVKPLSNALTSLTYALHVLDLSDPVGTYATSTSSGGGSGNGGGNPGGGYTYNSSGNSASAYQYWM